MRGARLALALVLLGVLGTGAPGAAATPPPPAELQIEDGGGWHADTAFRLVWADPPSGSPALVATRFRLRDPQGTMLREGRVGWIADGLEPLLVPATPGVYGAEVWFEDAAGEEGPAAALPLRFDDTRPAAVEPGSVPPWIGRADLPLHVRIAHPAGPLPLSGIRGYAAAIDSAPAGAPCARPDRCSVAETTLPGGAGDDELSLPALPEGDGYLHVVAVSGSGMKSATSGTAALHVDTIDPLTTLSGAPAGWTNRTVHLRAGAADGGSGMAPAGGPTPYTAIRVDDGAPSVAPGDSVAAEVIAEGSHRVAYYARDAAGNADDGAQTNGVADPAPRTAWVRIDRTPPWAAFANSQNPADPELIRVRIADPLSGPDAGRGWIGVRRAGSGDRFQPLPAAAPGSGELRARWDSDSYSSGAYEFHAVAYDAAGNATTTTRRANGAPMILTNPLKTTTRLRAAFRPHGRHRLVPYGRRIGIHGRLVAGLHSPLAGMPLRIVERFAAGAHPGSRVRTVRTGPAGVFSVHSSPGPSRTIEFLYPDSDTLARTSGDSLRLDVRSRVRLRGSTAAARVGGRPLVFRGRVLAPAGTIPRRGLPVQLQFRLGRSPWSEFRTVQTDRRGRFRYAYRFSDDDSRGVRFQFRAYVPAHENWPYEPAGSRPVIVRGY